MTLNQIAFLFLGLLALLGGIGVVFLKSPVRAALSLVLNFFVLGLLYFMLGAQIIGMSQIMVYAGAIMVLFLFVIMMLRSDGKTDKPQATGGRFMFSLIGAILVAGLIGLKVISPLGEVKQSPVHADYGSPQYVGTELFTSYVWPFEIISVLLMLGIVGSIMLAKRRF